LTRQFSEFFKDARARKLQESTLKKYRVLTDQHREYAADHGLLALKQLDLSALLLGQAHLKSNNIPWNNVLGDGFSGFSRPGGSHPCAAADYADRT